MRLFSCFFGQAKEPEVTTSRQPVERAQKPNVIEDASMGFGRHERSHVAPAMDKIAATAAHAGACASSSATVERAVDIMGEVCQSQASQTQLSGLAAELLTGLSFSTRVLGVGSYGIVVKGSMNGVEVAVKFMVTTIAGNRAPATETALAPSPALAHPHICKSHAARSAILTDDLFDDLEAERERQLQRQRLQNELVLQKQQKTTVPPIATSGLQPSQPQPCLPDKGGGSGGSGTGRAVRDEERLERTAVAAAAAVKLLNGRRRHVPHRLICYRPRNADSSQRQMFPDRMAPLESESPLAVLHEILYRLDAATGQQVTLVVLEYCCRGTLCRAIDRGIFQPCRTWGLRLARRALVRSLAEVARAMLHLHRGGILHGDLKPANVLLKSHKGDRRGFTIKVSDFGLAHQLPEGGQSLDSCTWGTPYYMAPEALMGHMGKASDVWSFGVMMCEAMTQTAPYGKKTLRADALVLGIIEGSLQLKWPPRPDTVLAAEATTAARSGGGSETTTDGIIIGAGEACDNNNGGGAAARLARQYGLVFPQNTLPAMLPPGPAGVRCLTDAAPTTGGSTVCSGCTDLGFATATTATATGATTNNTMIRTVTNPRPLNGHTAPGQYSRFTTAVGSDMTTGCTSGSRHVADSTGPEGAVCVGGGAGAGEMEDLDLVFDCLIALGRRCTHRDARQRPCFAEILGELIDMEIIMRVPRRRGESQQQQQAVEEEHPEADLRAQARSALIAASAQHAVTAAAAAAEAKAARAAAATSRPRRLHPMVRQFLESGMVVQLALVTSTKAGPLQRAAAAIPEDAVAAVAADDGAVEVREPSRPNAGRPGEVMAPGAPQPRRCLEANSAAAAAEVGAADGMVPAAAASPALSHVALAAEAVAGAGPVRQEPSTPEVSERLTQFLV